jgi:hypothetical protein
MDVPHARITTCHILYFNLHIILSKENNIFKNYIFVHSFMGPDFIPERAPESCQSAHVGDTQILFKKMISLSIII